jgi:hypothetical protein
MDVPAHVKLVWFDAQILPLPDDMVARIAAYPDKE